MSYLIKQEEIGDYRINVYQDETAGCPCSEFDLTGLYLWEFSDCHRLHDACNYEELLGSNIYSLEDTLRRLVCEYVSQKKIIDYINSDSCDGHRMRYDKSKHKWYLEYYGKYDWTNEVWHAEYDFTPRELREYDNREFLCEVLEKVDLENLLYNCKDVAFYGWSSCGYCQGDYVYGIAYCDKERFAKMCDTNTVNWRQRALKLFNGEVFELGKWLWGDVCAYTLEKKEYYNKSYSSDEIDDEMGFDWRQIDSCCGYYMDADDLIEEVIAEHGLQEKSAA